MTTFRPGDVVRVRAAVLAPDHNGDPRRWAPHQRLRVLGPAVTAGDVRVVDDVRGLRTVLPETMLEADTPTTGG